MMIETQGQHSSQSILQIEGLCLRFGGIEALRKVSFSVAPGSITALIGPNGAGKTSLFNCISGLYKPFSGDILFEGSSIACVPPPDRAKLGLARSFQNIALFRGMTVLENIKLGRHAHMKSTMLDGLIYRGRAKREEEALSAEIDETIIDILHIRHVRDETVASLPYGLQKRVEIARAMAMKPKILLLDEPVAGMSREEREDIASLILELREKWRVTVLMVEHDMGLVMDISDHVVVLSFGRMIAEGRPEEIQQNPEVITAYLGSNAAGQLASLQSGERRS